MERVVERLLRNWSHEPMGSMSVISLMQEHSAAWTVTLGDGSSGVAIEVDGDLVVNESFANATLKTIRPLGSEVNYLVLCSQAPTRGFAVLCSEFLDPGENGEIRAERKADPVAWWGSWCELLGNRNARQRVYDVIGEMVALRFLQLRGGDPIWRGPHAGRYDIECSNILYEVKSTQSRNSKRFQAHGLFQFDEHKREEKLFYCRLEEAESGVSINSLERDLIAGGYDRFELDVALGVLGYPAGKSVRDRQYAIVSMELFDVDEDFPHIESASFVGGALPLGVVSMNYDVDLSSVQPDEVIDMEWFNDACSV